MIFNGTSSRPARNFAEVSLLLNNTARTAPPAYNDRPDRSHPPHQTTTVPPTASTGKSAARACDAVCRYGDGRELPGPRLSGPRYGMINAKHRNAASFSKNQRASPAVCPPPRSRTSPARADQNLQRVRPRRQHGRPLQHAEKTNSRRRNTKISATRSRTRNHHRLSGMAPAGGACR